MWSKKQGRMSPFCSLPIQIIASFSGAIVKSGFKTTRGKILAIECIFKEARDGLE
jgi:hypothetical protein